MQIRPAVLIWLIAAVAVAQEPESAATEIEKHQYDLTAGGRTFLLDEAARASFFLLGELHGDQETPALIRAMWPSLWKAGYRHVAAEVSPWAAQRLESASNKTDHGLWRKAEADAVTALKEKASGVVLWGCDIEEARPADLIRDIALENPRSSALQKMVERTRERYQRAAAAELLDLARQAARVRALHGRSLLESAMETLEVEALRASPSRRFEASVRRELVMKTRFIDNYRNASGRPRVMARFGRNHLHRGYDRRGVSTLGNFIAEFAVAQRMASFHVAAFGAAGQIRWGGKLLEWDETEEDPAFAFLAERARFAETIFDLRPIRLALRRVAESKRSAVENALLYWADSYDAIICYRTVTPLP